MHDSFHNDTNGFLLTAAVTADPTKVDNGYIVPDFCRLVFNDFVKHNLKESVEV
jgi:hypothetical protein